MNHPENFVPKQQPAALCINCKAAHSNFYCARCSSLYCSRNCQVEDWPVHKAICNEMPELMERKKRVDSAIIMEIPSNGPVTNLKLPNMSIPPPNLQPQQQRVDNIPRNDQNQKRNNSQHNNNRNNSNSPPNQNGYQQRNNQNQQRNNQHQKQNRFSDKDNSPQHKNPMTNGNQNKPNLQNGHHSDTTPMTSKSTSNSGSPQTSATPNQANQGVVLIDFPKSNALINITGVISPDVVYIRPVEKFLNQEYCQIIQAVQTYAKNAKPITKLPSRGDLYITDFQQTGFYRALVVKADDENNILVAFIDFGNTDIKKMSELREIKSELARMPRHALRVKLSGVKVNASPRSEDAKDVLHKLCDDLTDLRIKYDGTYSKDDPIELLMAQTNESINKKIMNALAVNEPGINDRIIMMADIPKRLLPTGNNIEVVVTDNSMVVNNFVSCAIPTQYKETIDLAYAIDKYCQNTNIEPYTPRLYEACLFKFKQNWYRGACLESVGDGVITVIFLDHGNMQCVPIQWVRRMPEQFSKSPCGAVSCLVNDIPDNLSELDIVKMSEIFVNGKTLLIDKVQTVETVGGDDDDVPEETSVLNVVRVEQYFATKRRNASMHK